MLRIVGQQPAFEMLVHQCGRDRKMQRGRATISERPWVQLSFDRGRVIDDAQACTACEHAKVFRMIRIRWMMLKFRSVTFDDAVGVMDAELMLIDKEPIGWRLAFEKCDCAFRSPNPANERTGEQGDDAEVSDKKGDVMLSPRPARDRGDGEVRAKQNQPKIEPRRTVNVGARHVRVETRFVKSSGDRGNNQNREQNNGELERCKKTKERIFLPNRPRG